MTHLRCDACGFVATGGPHSLASVCPCCRTRGRIVPLTRVRWASPPSRVRTNGAPAGEGAMGARF
jgi:hypothetical protein